ncbi:T9SS type A sorting domain-containing protein, partial [bacterium]|nr:T9SS type A sorting domain-containing protein [bacterium]
DPFEIIEKSSVAVASDHLMLTNYPNPFNPETTISFALPEACQISLTVYDVAGRNVVSLIDGWREAGSHEISFNASHLPSGVYIYQLNTGASALSGKMLLLK